MFRKLSLVVLAAASLGMPRWPRPRPRPGVVAFMAADGTAAGMAVAWRLGCPRFYVGGPAYYSGYGYGYGGCYVRRLVPTPWGPRWRLINRCY